MNTLFSRFAVFFLLTASFAVNGAGDPDVTELRETLEQLKQDYEARIRVLEQRIERAEQKVSAVETTSGAGTPKPGGDRSFNPAISLVLQGSTVRYSRDPEEWALPGFQTGGESGLGEEGLQLNETELIASANVDHWFFAQATLGLHEEEGGTEVDLEEAFVDTLSLPGGFGLRVGRFFTETGYLNAQHTHAWDFADAPLTSQAFLGKHYYDDGVRLSWLAPTDLFLEMGAETLRGAGFPVGNDGDRFAGGVQNYFARLGRDVGVSHSFRLGVSHLRGDADAREAGHGHGHGEHEEESFAFGGDTDLSVLDFIWKWAPNGDARRQNFVFQAEYFRRDEDGEIEFADDTGEALIDYSGAQQGYYAQGVYQFMPRWRAGLRYDQLQADNQLSVLSNTSGESDDELLEESGLMDGHKPRRWTFMTDYTHSEFSKLRFQYARDRSRTGDADNQFQIQYIMTLGAHGAHKY